MPTTVPLEVYRGDDQTWTVDVYTDAEETVPDNLAGATVKAEVRAVSAGQVLATLGTVVTLPNTVTVALASAASTQLPAGRLKWDLQVTYTDNRRRTPIVGPVTVTADVTDSGDLEVNPLDG